MVDSKVVEFPCLFGIINLVDQHFFGISCWASQQRVFSLFSGNHFLFPSAGIHHPHTQFTYPPLFCVKRHIVWNLRGPCMNANSLSVHERSATPADAEKVMKQIHLESAAVCWPTNDGSFFILIVRPGNQTWLVGATLVSGRSKEI